MTYARRRRIAALCAELADLERGQHAERATVDVRWTRSEDGGYWQLTADRYGLAADLRAAALRNLGRDS